MTSRAKHPFCGSYPTEFFATCCARCLFGDIRHACSAHTVARASPTSGIFRTAISEISCSDQITSFAKLRRQPDTKSEEEPWEKEQQIGNWEEILPFRTHARLQEMGRSKTNSGAGQQILPPALQMLQGNVPRQRGETLAGAA
ncbi:hypothetical protein AVEN_153062-1, partial [Araneus ventricosus]